MWFDHYLLDKGAAYKNFQGTDFYNYSDERIQNKTVLVHCYAGMQRSAAIVAAYLIKYKNMSYEDAVQFIRKKRKVSFLTGSNFNIALLLFEKQVHEHSKLNNNNH